MSKSFSEIVIYCIAFFLFSYVNRNDAQESEDEQLAEVTLEMFTLLQSEVLVLQAELVALQEEMQSLGKTVSSLSAQPPLGSTELADLKTLVSVSNRQEEDITKLFYTNGIWQQNFKVVNATFERLKKVAVFSGPALTVPSVASAVRRVLPLRNAKQNITSGIVTTTTQPTTTRRMRFRRP